MRRLLPSSQERSLRFRFGPIDMPIDTSECGPGRLVCTALPGHPCEPPSRETFGEVAVGRAEQRKLAGRDPQASAVSGALSSARNRARAGRAALSLFPVAGRLRRDEDARRRIGLAAADPLQDSAHVSGHILHSHRGCGRYADVAHIFDWRRECNRPSASAFPVLGRGRLGSAWLPGRRGGQAVVSSRG